MAWLQNLAGKAENLLVKFDENAANVFNESNMKHVGSETNTLSLIDDSVINHDVSIAIETNPSSGKLNTMIDESETPRPNDTVSILSEKTRIPPDNEDSGIQFTANLYNKRKTPSPTSNNSVDTSLKKEFKSDGSGLSSKSGSLQNSFIFMDDSVIKYEDKIGKLEQENEEINQQLINVRHMYCELQNEYSNLESQLERTNETLIVTQTEMEQYRARAQRILQEKEKLIRLKQDEADIENNDLIISNYHDELRKELKFQEEKNVELADKLLKLNNELTAIQQNFMIAQKDNQTAKQVLQDSLMREKKIRSVAEEECRSKSKDLQSRLQEIAHQNNIIASKSQKILHLEDQLKQKCNTNINVDVEERIQNLTHTLMLKQNNLETITSERNALRLQLEKLENEYRQLMAHSQRSKVKSSTIIEPDEGKSQIPRLFKLSPFDMGVTRRVKHAYSSLDAISIRTGIFLRRYSIARLFVLCYIVLLHVWVLIILCTYIPAVSH